MQNIFLVNSITLLIEVLPCRRDTWFVTSLSCLCSSLLNFSANEKSKKLQKSNNSCVKYSRCTDKEPDHINDHLNYNFSLAKIKKVFDEKPLAQWWATFFGLRAKIG